jgi:hypothetical protein
VNFSEEIVELIASVQTIDQVFKSFVQSLQTVLSSPVVNRKSLSQTFFLLPSFPPPLLRLLIIIFLSSPAFLATTKKLVIEIMNQVVLATENVNQNLLLEYFVVVGEFFDTLMHLLVDPLTRSHLSFDVLFLLSTFMNYRKYERSNNPYLQRASNFAIREPLENFVSTVADVLGECNRCVLVLFLSIFHSSSCITY